jgi:ribonuclease HIII
MLLSIETVVHTLLLQHEMQTQETEKEVFVIIVHFGPHRLQLSCDASEDLQTCLAIYVYKASILLLNVAVAGIIVGPKVCRKCRQAQCPLVTGDGGKIFRQGSK